MCIPSVRQWLVAVVLLCVTAELLPADEPELTDRRVHLPVGSAVLVTDLKAESLCVISINPDPVTFYSTGCVNIWHFPEPSVFYQSRANPRLPARSPFGSSSAIKHRLISASIQSKIFLLSHQFEWSPSTSRGSWLKAVQPDGLRFGMWRVKDAPPNIAEFVSFSEMAKAFNDESLRLGSVPIGGDERAKEKEDAPQAKVKE